MFLRLFYYFLKYTSILLVHLYYKITFLNKEKFQLPAGACIMTSNHPNTLIDVFLSVPFINRRSHFLANASLFKHPFFNWMWRKLWCIPIKRRKDKVDGINNQDSFEACDQFLSSGGLLFIAPEGTSYNERHLREFRPGTAKIALSAEAKNDFKLGLKICCFGVTYEKPWRFRSHAYANAAAPIVVADYRQVYEKDPETAIDILTQVIENQTRSIVVDAADLAQDHLLGKIEQLNESIFWEQKGRFFSPKERFDTAQQLATQLKTQQHTAPSEYALMESTVNQYFSNLKENRLSEKAIASIFADNSWWMVLLLTLFNFPFFLLGFLCNLLPYSIIEGLWRKLKLDGYEATVRITLGGLIIFPLCYWWSGRLLHHYLPIPYIGLLFWFLAISLGIFAWNYIEFIQFHAARLRFIYLDNDLRQKIMGAREKALHEIKDILK
jgi:glycerol-3-phosphate O-acyltransferase / dihydroxyacetone phosphate acyltransferase